MQKFFMVMRSGSNGRLTAAHGHPFKSEAEAETWIEGALARAPKDGPEPVFEIKRYYCNESGLKSVL